MKPIAISLVTLVTLLTGQAGAQTRTETPARTDSPAPGKEIVRKFDKPSLESATQENSPKKAQTGKTSEKKLPTPGNSGLTPASTVSDLEKLLNRGGSNIGGADPMVDAGIKFGKNLLENLAEVSSTARAYWDGGNIDLALKTYQDGIAPAVAAATQPGQQLGLVYQNSARVLDLSTRLSELNASRAAQRAVYEFYLKLITTVSKFDRETYIAHASHSSRVKVDAARLTEGLRAYAFFAINQSRDSFTFRTKHGQMALFNTPEVRGETVYLTVMSVVVQGLAQDLRDTGLHEASLELGKIKSAIDSELSQVETSDDPGASVVSINEKLKALAEGI